MHTLPNLTYNFVLRADVSVNFDDRPLKRVMTYDRLAFKILNCDIVS